jgi:uncharacterized membrane protein
MEPLILVICVIVIWNLVLTKRIQKYISGLKGLPEEAKRKTPVPKPAQDDEFGLFFSTVESIKKRRLPIPSLKQQIARRMDSKTIEGPSIAIPQSGSRPIPKQTTKQTTKDTKPKAKRPIEQWIGTQLLSKLGLALFIIGMGMLLKHTLGFISKPEIANSILGLLSGATSLFFGYRLRTKTPTFAAILTAGGFVLFHLTLMVGHLYYEIYSDLIATVLYSLNALAASYMAIRRNRPELLIIAQIGVWISPFSTPDLFDAPTILLTYILAFSSGALAIGLYKGWKFPMMAAWVGCVIHIFLLLFSTGLSFTGGLLLVAIHIAFSIPLFVKANRELWDLKSRSVYALGSQLFFMLIGTWLIDANAEGNWLGSYALCMGIISWTLYLLNRRKKVIVAEFWTLPLAIITSALAPILHFEVQTFALVLSLEATALTFIGLKHTNRALKGYGMMVLVLGCFATVFQCVDLWASRPLDSWLFINASGLSILGFIVSSVLIARMYFADNLIRLPLFGLLSSKRLPLFLRRSVWFILYAYTSIELISWSSMHLHNNAIILVVGTYQLFCFLTVAHLSSNIDRWRALQVTGGIFLLTYGLLLANPAQELFIEALQGKINVGWTIAHIPALVICMYLAVRSWNFVATQAKMDLGKVLNLVIMTIGWILVLSREFDLVALQFHMPMSQHISDTIRAHRLWGYAPLWSMLAFVFVWIGFKKSRLTDRWAGLGIFSLLLIKLFFLDIFELPKGAQIMAFMVLGLLLIVVSFFYHKLKELLTSKEP